jgi:UDP-N-acetylglucosamine 4-epimerase
MASTHYLKLQQQLRSQPNVWLITGVAGFIGSNLLESLLHLGQTVVGLDDFSTGYEYNLQDVREKVGEEAWSRFKMVSGDVTNLDTCRMATNGVNYVLHQAGLGSVPLSVADPIRANQVNVDGCLNMLVAARDAGVKRFVYATSSAVYGDDPRLPKLEISIGQALSPYSITKYVNELYANIFTQLYGLECIGLRYFNVFGPRQDPDGAYSAVIPKWFASLLRGEKVYINGDGENSRDFCYVEDVVQANLLAACVDRPEAISQVYNIGGGHSTTLNHLFELIQEQVLQVSSTLTTTTPTHRQFREGDIRHSVAHIGKAKELLKYAPAYSVKEGLQKAANWYFGEIKPTLTTNIK